MEPNKHKKFFVEVGSSDFDTCLPLVANGWTGLIIEPVKPLLDNLPETPGITYDCCALAPETGKADVRYYDPKFTEGNINNNFWARGVGNINPNFNHFKLNPQWVKEERVDTVNSYTLQDLFKKHNIEKVDFLKLDCEGMDYPILKNYDWSVKPAVMTVEQAHEDSGLGLGYGSGAIRGLLEKAGYLVVDKDGDNITAIW